LLTIIACIVFANPRCKTVCKDETTYVRLTCQLYKFIGRQFTSYYIVYGFTGFTFELFSVRSTLFIRVNRVPG